MVAARGRGGKWGLSVFNQAVFFRLGRMRTFWRWTVGMTSRHHKGTSCPRMVKMVNVNYFATIKTEWEPGRGGGECDTLIHNFTQRLERRSIYDFLDCL